VSSSRTLDSAVSEANEGPLPRKILMVLESVFPSGSGGGAEGQVLTLGRYLRAHGIEVEVVVPCVAHGPQQLSDAIDGLAITRIAYPRVAKLGGLVLGARLASLLLARRRSYGAVHVHVANNMAAVCSLIAVLTKRTTIVKPTGSFETENGILASHRRDVIIRVRRWAIRRATYYQAISRRTATALSECGFDPSRVRYIPNGVDTNPRPTPTARDAVRRELGIHAALVGVFTGRLVREKALDFFVDGWARAIPPQAPVVLLIVGDGPLADELKGRVQRLSIQSQVRFLGHHADVWPLLEASDFAVLPSSAEGLSNSLLEYMAAGLPILGSRVSGTEDLVQPGENGWLFTSHDEADLGRCLRELASTPPTVLREMGRRSRDSVAKVASVPVVVSRLAELYGLELIHDRCVEEGCLVVASGSSRGGSDPAG
jgi:glycosyltransferase involved in cell wall biosynthesis